MKELGITGKLAAALHPPDKRGQDGKWDFVREGDAILWLTWEVLPRGGEIHGQFYLREGRLHGRFTELLTPDGQWHPVCLVAWDVLARTKGLEIEAREGGVYKVWHYAELAPVQGFD